MNKSLNLNESLPSPFDSNDNSFDRSENISTSETKSKSFSSISFLLEGEQEIDNFRRLNKRFTTTFLRRSLSHKRLNSSFHERSKNHRGFAKQNLMGLPVFEVKEEQEKEASSKISKIKIIHDDEEFGTSHMSLSKSSRKSVTRDCRRGRSLDPLKLPKVEEAAMLEEDQIRPLNNLMKLDIFKDKNEFNLNLNKKLGSFIEKSQFLECSELPIEEELLEKEKPNIDHTSGLWSNVSSTNSSTYNSPRFKLKVDELDDRREIEKKRKFVGEKENEIIEEEEKNDHEDQFSEFMKNSRKSMKEEKCFMKKIIKGEIMEVKDLIALNLEKEFVSKGYIQPLFESEYEILSRSDSDSEKQGIKNRNIYEEMRILEAAFD